MPSVYDGTALAGSHMITFSYRYTLSIPTKITTHKITEIYIYVYMYYM